MIVAWHYVITGFQQSRGTRTRLQQLWLELHEELTSADTVVQSCSWNWNWNAEAEHVFRQSCVSPTIYVHAYSWGAGWGFVRFASELAARGLSVRHAVLIDPVYRSPLWLFGQWRVFFPTFPIRIPGNVREVNWFRQRQSHPMGHDLVAAEPESTTIHPVQELQADHNHMDDRHEVFELCKSVSDHRRR